jgi:hypothetical protein
MSIRKSPLRPARHDALILHAALLDGDRALDAWHAWRRVVDQTKIDFTQLRLIPLLHHNLRRVGVGEEKLAQYRNDTLVFWIRNQRLFKFASAEIQHLAHARIETLILKGVPLANLYYPTPGLRPMSDVDLFVRPEQAVGAMSHYIERGWSCSDTFVLNLDNLEQLVMVRNGLNMRDPVSGQEIDLHWKLLKNSLTDIDPLWSSSVCFELHSQALRTLCPSDQLLHVCAQAADWNVVRPVRWIPDASMIIRNADIDWDRLVEQAQRMDLVIATRHALGVLREFLDLDVPEAAIAGLRAYPASFLSRIDFSSSARSPVALIGRPLLRIVRYLRIGWPQGIGFFQYLNYMWGTPSIFRAFANGLRLIWGDTFRRKNT